MCVVEIQQKGLMVGVNDEQCLTSGQRLRDFQLG